MINVFEDPLAIREGGYLRLVRELETIPDDYGVAWRVPQVAVAVCAPMPFHRLMGWAYRVYWQWRASGKPDVLTEAYQAGLEEGQARADRRMAFARDQHAEELKVAEARGRHAMMTDLYRELDARSGRVN